MAERTRLGVSEWQEAAISLPPGQHEFAIGDAHGMSGQLRCLLAAMGKASGGRGHLTQLGDLCDRGPDSLGCYSAVFGAKPAQMGFSGVTGLLGNHEIFMLSVMSGQGPVPAQDILRLWIRNGADRFIDQLDPGGLVTGNDPAAVAALIRGALGTRVLSAVMDLKSHRRAGNLMFVHAGLNPGVPVAEWFARRHLEISHEDHFAWIRFPFFGHDGPYEDRCIVVHGHTPEPMIQRWKRGQGEPGRHGLDGWRLGLDGGSYATGLVAGAEFRNGAYRIYLAG